MNKNITGAPPRAAANHAGSGDANHRGPKGSNGTNGGALAAKLAEAAYLDADAALALLESDRNGLTEAEVEARRERYGRNQVAHEKPPTWYAELGRAFANPFNFLLTTLAIVSGVTGDNEGDDRHRLHGRVQHRACASFRNLVRTSPPLHSARSCARARRSSGPATSSSQAAPRRRVAGRSRWTSWCPATSCTCRPAT